MSKLVMIVIALALAVPALCNGQDPLGPTRLEIDRAELTRRLAQYDAVAQSTAYSDVLREVGQSQADIIRERLSKGDFRSGDQVELLIGGEESPQWNTLAVEAGPLLNVPTLGPISLQGVLRSELETHLGTEIGRFIRSPRVEAHALIRVSIEGGGQPGFHTVRADLPLSEVVMLAGGPGGSVPGRIRIERGEDVIWSVEELLAPLADGRSLDELGLQAGDRIVLPEAVGSTGVLWRVLRSAAYVALPMFLGIRLR